MILPLCLACFLLSSSIHAFYDEMENDNVDIALSSVSGSSVRYWKCAIENRSGKTLYGLGSTSEFGNLATPLPEIAPGTTGAFVWEKTSGSATGAAGVVHYTYGDKILNLMAVIPYDWNLHSSYCSVHVSNKMESFYDMYNGKGGCPYPVKGGNWAKYDGATFYLSDRSQAVFKVYFDG